jgi:hypothetical protein
LELPSTGDRTPEELNTAEFTRIAERHALWRLRFYCWRNMLALTVATAVAADSVIAIAANRPSALLTMLAQLLDAGK